MKSQDIKRAMIEVTVDQALREMKDDPKRSVRKLADLGKRFSKSRFRNHIFAIIQKILQNDNSPYYAALEQLLQQTETTALKKIGINIGYNSWTYGAKKIRELESLNGYNIPWNIIFRWNSKGKLTINRMEQLIKEGQAMGIYTYFIRQESSEGYKELLSLFNKYPDCAFIWFLYDYTLEDTYFPTLKTASNVMTVLNAENHNCPALTLELKNAKILYSVFYTYHDGDEEQLKNNQWISSLLGFHNIFLFFLADDTCSAQTRQAVGEYILQSRFETEYPGFLVDLYCDAMRIDQIISQESCLFEIDSDGTVLSAPQEDVKNNSTVLENVSLEYILQQTMPAVGYSSNL